MAEGESKKDASVRLLATAALGAGIGTALYKGFKEEPGSLQRTVEAVRGVPGMQVPRMMVSTPIDFQSDLLSKAFSAAEDTMSPGGMTELLSRAYERALYGAGVISDENRGRVVAELTEASKNWEMAQGAIHKYEQQLGGMEGLYKSMRELVGGTVYGNRSKDVGQLIRELPNIQPDEYGRKGGYLRSAFEAGGSFWEERFGLSGAVQEEITTKSIKGFSKAKTFAKATNLPVSEGIRESNRPRHFLKGKAGDFKFSVFGGSEVNLSYSEFRIGKSDRRWFLSAPNAVEHKGINFVAADHRGMGFASVPSFAVPLPGGKYKKVSWNKGLNIMLYGDEASNITGLAQRLHELHGDEKAMRDLTWEWNTKIRGMFHRITGSQSNMAQALMHSESILPIERVIADISGEEVDTSIEGLTKFYTSLKDSGFDVGPLAGADPMAKHYRVSTRDWAKRWDVFGEGYNIERKYAGRIKDFSMTDEAIKAMESSPLAGVLRRGHGITATAAARQEMNQMPQVAAYLTLGKAKHLGEEEAVISKKLAPMMKMKSIQKFEVLAGSIQGREGELLKQGGVIGVDYRTGETIFAKGGGGLVEQRIISARTVGNIVSLEVESQLPLQDQIKIFGYKAQIHVARGGISEEMIHEWGAGRAALKFQDDLEFIGHADLMKKIPQEINKQMSEASWLVMQKRLSEAGVMRSGGKSKVARQEIRAARGQKTYSWKGKLPKNYINMDMLMYVRNQQYRDKVLKNRQKGGARIAKRLGLEGEQKALGTGLEILRYAKKNNLSPDEMGLIGGAFYQQLEKAAGSELGAAKLLGEAGLTIDDIEGLKASKGVLAMPTMHVGGYASFDHKWGRAGMDYRALMELKAQQWGESGDLLIGEIARRVIPGDDAIEMERAASSLAGRGVPAEAERITEIRKAREALGQREFVFEYGGKELYVPGLKARGMGEFVSEIDDVRPKELQSAYNKYFGALERMRDRGGEKAEAALAMAEQNLLQKVHKGWASSGSLSGKVVGTAGPVARRRIPTNPAETIAKKFSSAEEFIANKGEAFTIGITKETGSKMFRDLISKSTTEERAFLEAQQEAFLAGKKVTSFVWRHPTHRPQSLMPAWLELVKGEGESAQFHKLELSHGDRVLDVSLAQGMKLDYDFDHVQMGLIADEKVKTAMDNLLNSRRFREQFIEGLSIQKDIMNKVKAAAAKGALTSNVEGYVAGLQKLVGVKMETGVISNLVGEMRAAAAFQTSGREYSIASYLLAELEEGPISSKHGLHVGEVKGHLQTFVRGEGVGVRGAMRDAWDKLLDEGVFTADKVKYSREEFIDKMGNWISASEESGNLAAFRDLARRASQAQKGKEWEGITNELLNKVIDMAQGGRGDLNAVLTREMRLGPGSALTKSRRVIESMGNVAGTAMRAFKKHWKYPAMGFAVAAGVSMLGGNGLSMRDHSQQVDALGQGSRGAEVAIPSMSPNRIVTGGGSMMPAGFQAHTTGDYSPQQISQLGVSGQDFNSSVRIRDDRGSITPEYIEKASRERYY